MNKKLGIFVGSFLFGVTVASADAPIGLYRCAKLGGRNPFGLSINACPPDTCGLMTVNGYRIQVNPRTIDMSEEENGEFSLWFLNQAGERRVHNEPDAYCTLTALPG